LEGFGGATEPLVVVLTEYEVGGLGASGGTGEQDEACARAALAANKSIDLGLAHATPAVVEGDPASLAILLSNLIDNALRYGGAPVDVVARSEGASVVIEVGDRGPGIPPDQVDRLKRPFTRGEPARSGASGAGLGLAIVERIARLHGARFDVLAREGGGTLARVTMPSGAAL